MSAKKKSASKPQRLLVRATRFGVYNSRRRYPAQHGHRDSGKPFYLIERKKIDKFSGEVTVISPEEQFSEKWMEKVDETGLRIEAQEAAAKAREEEMEIEAELDQTGVAAPPGPGDEGEIRSHPNTVGEKKKRKSRKKKEERASDEEVI